MPGGPSWPRGWKGERGKEPGKTGQVARMVSGSPGCPTSGYPWAAVQAGDCAA